MKVIMISKAAWEDIRKKFQDDPGFRATSHDLLAEIKSIESNNTAQRSASCLKDFGIIDSTGKLTKRGQRWIDNRAYPDVCWEIINEAFPSEAIPVLSDAKIGRQEKLECLQEFGGFKEDGARKTLRFFNMLADATEKSALKPDRQNIAKQANENKTSNTCNPTSTASTPPAPSTSQKQGKQEVSMVVDPSFPPENLTATLEAISLAFPNAKFEISMKA